MMGFADEIDRRISSEGTAERIASDRFSAEKQAVARRVAALGVETAAYFERLGIVPHFLKTDKERVVESRRLIRRVMATEKREAVSPDPVWTLKTRICIGEDMAYQSIYAALQLRPNGQLGNYKLGAAYHEGFEWCGIESEILGSGETVSHFRWAQNPNGQWYLRGYYDSGEFPDFFRVFEDAVVDFVKSNNHK